MIGPNRVASESLNDIASSNSIAVIIATLGRPQIASETVRRIVLNQYRKPSILIISCVTREDAGDIAGIPGVVIVTGKPGLAAQRNLALSKVPEGTDILVFFDDDFIPCADWLEKAQQIFRNHPDISGLTGDVISDGIKGPGLNFDDVDKLLRESNKNSSVQLIEPFSPYGCNMAFRRRAIGSSRFDERLILYGWLEDRDFGASLIHKGARLAKSLELRGVHMGVKSGRIAGDRLGYSQVVNPLYLLSKGNMSPKECIGQMVRNIASNFVRSIVPEKFIDRRGRLRGNMIGLLDIMRGRVQPERAAMIRNRSK